MNEIERLLKFAKFLHLFQSVERAMWIKGREHQENDAEHSFHLAMLAWYAIETNKLPLDVSKAIQYALMHDLVEAYAGDVDSMDTDPERDTKKAAKEHEALLQIKKDFPEFPEMIEIIENYELRNDEESKFVYALDKVVGPINIYIDGGRTWHKKGISLSLEQHVATKNGKVSAHPEVKKYFDQMLEILKKEESMLFPQEEKHEA